MSYVIAEPCIDVQDQACVNVCPVACIQGERGKDRKLYIDPGACIDCGACEPMCPVEAIFAECELMFRLEPVRPGRVGGTVLITGPFV